MTEKTPVADLSQALAQFDRTVTARDASTNAYRLRIEAYHQWNGLQTIRGRTLEQILEQKGLGVCSEANSHTRPEVWLRINVEKERGKIEIDKEELKKMKPEDLGIFPKSMMRLHFKRFTARAHQGHPSLERLEQFEELELLCPKHFPKPKDTNKWWGSNAEDRYKEGPDMESEVIEKDGKLITRIGDVDVTKIPVETGYNEMVFQYMGLPQLPPEPKI